MSRDFSWRMKCSFYFCVLSVLFFSFSGNAQTPPIYVTLWFDTEDYILPESDDAAKRLAEMLTRLGIKATFKVVGEKAGDGRTASRRSAELSADAGGSPVSATRLRVHAGQGRDG